jgi:hypothetical protein
MKIKNVGKSNMNYKFHKEQYKLGPGEYSQSFILPHNVDPHDKALFSLDTVELYLENRSEKNNLINNKVKFKLVKDTSTVVQPSTPTKRVDSITGFNALMQSLGQPGGWEPMAAKIDTDPNVYDKDAILKEIAEKYPKKLKLFAKMLPKTEEVVPSATMLDPVVTDPMKISTL